MKCITWTGRLCNIPTVAIFPKAIYRFSPISIKMSMAFLQTSKSQSQIHMKLQRASNSQNNIEKEKVGDSNL